MNHCFIFSLDLCASVMILISVLTRCKRVFWLKDWPYSCWLIRLIYGSCRIICVEKAVVATCWAHGFFSHFFDNLVFKLMIAANPRPRTLTSRWVELFHLGCGFRLEFCALSLQRLLRFERALCHRIRGKTGLLLGWGLFHTLLHNWLDNFRSHCINSLQMGKKYLDWG